MSNYGKTMYSLIEELFPICRSLTGKGVVETLERIQKEIPIKIKQVPTGTKVFDWHIPKEWRINDAYIMDETGQKVVDFKENNLHVMGYSVPVNEEMTLDELNQHLYSLEEMPNAIPYVTSYYKERWGFCLTHEKRNSLKEGNYKVVIDSELKDGHLTYGELIIPGETKEEIFFSTYVCHPSMANNELSGPAVVTELVKWLLTKQRKYTYRIVFIPETIGSITYLSRNFIKMKERIIAGFNVSCVGDDRAYSYLASKYGNTLSDRVAKNVLGHKTEGYHSYSFLERGSDERQYCSPGIDLPVVSIMRTKYGEYPEYHTSLDNLDLVSESGLQGSFDVYKSCVDLLEANAVYKVNCFCEPQLGKRGLYPTISTKSSGAIVRDMMNFITYADGTNDLIAISDIIGVSIDDLKPIIEKLSANNLISEINDSYESEIIEKTYVV